MAMLISPESEYGKELAKWNKPHNPSDPRNQFPKMLYQAQKRPDGVYSTGETNDALFGGRDRSAEEFTRRCQKIVHSEAEERMAMGIGWCLTQALALERLKSEEEYLSTAAAHRLYEDRNLSDAAKAEAAAADAATPEHLPAIPEARRGPGRPRKVVEAS